MKFCVGWRCDRFNSHLRNMDNLSSLPFCDYCIIAASMNISYTVWRETLAANFDVIVYRGCLLSDVKVSLAQLF